jgi:excisionase family DNA binding protein
MIMSSPLLYTVPQITEMLSIGRTAAYELIKSGRLRSVKIGNSRRIPAVALDEFLESIQDAG